MGRGVEDIQEEFKLFPFRLAEDLQPGEVAPHQAGRQDFHASRNFGADLRQLKRNAERFFGGPVTQAVITGAGVFQRRTAPGHERRRPHRGTGSTAPGE